MKHCVACLAPSCVCLRSPSYAFHFNLGEPRRNRYLSPLTQWSETLTATRIGEAKFDHSPLSGQSSLIIGSTLHEIGEIIGWGAHGLVLANREHTRVYKIMRGDPLQRENIMSEIVHTELASRLQAGPKFYGWAPLEFPTQDSFFKFIQLPTSPAFFETLAALSESERQPPQWLREGLVAKPEELTLLVIESWDASLLTYLTENAKQWIDLVNPDVVNPHVLEGFITRLLELHDHDFIHGDLLPKNILVRYDRASKRISAMTLTDFGMSGALDEWFFNTDSQHRDVVLGYFSNSITKWPEQWRAGSYYADMIEVFREPKKPDIAALSNWQYWLSNDPFNMDLGLLYYLARETPSLWPLFLPKTPTTAYNLPNYFNWKYEGKSPDGDQLTNIVVEQKWIFQLVLYWLDTARQIKQKIERATKGTLKNLQFSTPRGIPSEDEERRMQYSELVEFESHSGPLHIQLTARVRRGFLKTVEWQDYVPPPILYSDESSISSDE